MVVTKRPSLGGLSIFLVLSACSGGGSGPLATAKFPSKSSTIALSEDEKRVLIVNQDDGSVSVFDADTNTKITTLTTGNEPSAVVIAADNKTAYVANRADATVVKITGIDGASPAVAATIEVGSEPTGLALSPSGASLFVAEFAEGRVVKINTADMTEVAVNEAPINPRAIAVTNDGDGEDDDETVVLPEFFGQSVGNAEATNNSRQGFVRLYGAKALEPIGQGITFDPRDSGFKKDLITGGDGAPDPAADVRGQGDPVVTSPNQLFSVAISGTQIYVTSVSASPALPVRFNSNVFPVVLIADLATRTEDTSATGSFNLLAKIAEARPKFTPDPAVAAEKRLAMGEIVDIAFVGERKIAYIVSRAADAVQRVTFDGSIGLGAAQNFQIDVVGDAPVSAGCKNPTGLVAKSDGTKLWLNCWVSKKLGFVDLSSQTFSTAVDSVAFPAPGSDAEKVVKGKRFYFTGRGRWSKGGEGWSSCGSCHPDGLSDNITWVFGTGPRQTTAQDGSFSHGKTSAGKQRVFNWTGIFDEHHDFERNVRGVSGGIGVVTKPKAGASCGRATDEDPIALVVTDNSGVPIPNPMNPAVNQPLAGLARPVKELNEITANSCRHTEWDEVDEFVKTIRPTRALRKLDTAAVARGRVLFEQQGQCHKCHGGPGWTLSRRFFTPSGAGNATLAGETYNRPAGVAAAFSDEDGGRKIGVQLAVSSASMATVAPPRVACTIRKVATFGLPGDATATTSLEKKDDGTLAQGEGGYNVPSLYGMALGAPYLHHGAARTLDDLFVDSRWATHKTAGNPNFAPSESERADLVAFLLSIDANTDEIAVPATFDNCQ